MSSRTIITTSLALVAAVAAPSGAAFAQRGAAPRDTIRLSVEDAVTRAMRQSPEARIAAAQIDVADAQITTARATGLPQLSFNGSYQQVLENARASIVSNVFGQAFTYTANARLSQTLFQGGRVIAGARAAGDVRNASRLDQQETRSLVSVTAQRAYLDALFTAQLVDIERQNLALAQERVAQLEQLEKGGRASRYDVLTARVSRSNLEPQVIQAQSNRELALLTLKQILNIPADQPVALTSALDPAGVAAVVERAMADTALPVSRPAVRSAEYTLEARKQGIRVARADFLPTVSAFIQSGYLALPASNGLPTSFGRTAIGFCADPASATRPCQNNGWFADRNFGVQISWPIFDGLRTKGNLDLAQAQARLAEVQVDQVRERVAIELAQAQSELERARAAYAAQRQNAGEAEEAFRLASLRFTRGLSTQLEVSDAQLALLTAQTNELRAVYDLYLATAEVARARGGSIPLPPTRRVER
jgi:outer membrane protein TolC